MAIQLIFCVETNKRADTDSIYISETINHLYLVNNKTKISKVYMNTKTRYKARDVLKEIAGKIKAFTIGETRVIYCIDTDEYEKDAGNKRELDEIRRFCKESCYDLVWFCHDVEDVYLGRKIPDSAKVQEASAFRRKRKIEEMDFGKLAGCTERVHTSNILNILDQYLPRKQQISLPN